MTQGPPPPPPPPSGPSPYASWPPAYAYAPPRGPAPGVLYAGFWIRLLAFLVDWLIVDIPIAIIGFIVAAPSFAQIHCTTVYGADNIAHITCTGFQSLTPAIGLAWLLWFLAPAVYFIALWTAQGRTLGQRLVGLHVVDAHTGGRISLGRAIGRYIGFLVSSWVLFIGLIWAAFDPQKQGWHDKMAATFVVRNA